MSWLSPSRVEDADTLCSNFEWAEGYETRFGKRWNESRSHRRKFADHVHCCRCLLRRLRWRAEEVSKGKRESCERSLLIAVFEWLELSTGSFRFVLDYVVGKQVGRTLRGCF